MSHSSKSVDSLADFFERGFQQSAVPLFIPQGLLVAPVLDVYVFPVKLDYTVQIWQEEGHFIAHAMPLDVASSSPSASDWEYSNRECDG